MNTKIYKPLYTIFIILTIFLIIIELIGFNQFIYSFGFILFLITYGILLSNRFISMKSLKKYSFQESEVQKEIVSEAPHISIKIKLIEITAIILLCLGYIFLFF